MGVAVGHHENIDINGWWKFCLPGVDPRRHRQYAEAHFRPEPGDRLDAQHRRGIPRKTYSERVRRRVVTMAREGHSSKEISEATGISPKTIYTWLDAADAVARRRPNRRKGEHA